MQTYRRGKFDPMTWNKVFNDFTQLMPRLELLYGIIQSKKKQDAWPKE
jgi:hypothetical protein